MTKGEGGNAPSFFLYILHKNRALTNVAPGNRQNDQFQQFFLANFVQFDD
jgi:hypothetical protein